MKPVRYHILLALADGPKHGAEVRRRVTEQSEGATKVYPAMLYGSLDDLTDLGWIVEAEQPSPGSEQTRWRFYGLTPEGRGALEAETNRLELVLARARASLRPA